MKAILPSHLEFTSSAVFREDEENYLTTITGKLICYDEANDKECEAGQITALYLDVSGAHESDFPITAIIDLHQEAQEQYRVLFDHETGEMKEEILAIHEPYLIGSNWLILSRLEIRPAFRGQKLGLATMYRTMQQFGHGCALISLEVVPLQVENREGNPDKEQWFIDMEMGSFTTDIPLATQRLKDYYSLLGFQEVTGTNIMILNPSYQQPNPTISR